MCHQLCQVLNFTYLFLKKKKFNIYFSNFFLGKASFHKVDTNCSGTPKASSGAGTQNSNGGGCSGGLVDSVKKTFKYRDLKLYSQTDVFSLKTGEKLPTIINPGLDPSDGLCELVEGRDYNPDDFVQVAGYDLFENAGNYYLLGE